MSAPVLRAKVFPRVVVKTKGNVIYPARFFEGPGIDIVAANGALTIGLNYAEFDALTNFDASAKIIAVYDPATGVWNKISLATLINAGQTTQIITAGDVTVANNDGLIVVNKTVGAATTVTLGAASSKIGPVKIVDFKADSGTNNITINAAGSDKFNGNLSTWVIGADGGSVVLHPTTSGWAV